jgi:hypothetical protein
MPNTVMNVLAPLDAHNLLAVEKEHPRLRIVPFELDVAAPQMIRRQDIDAHALAVVLDPTLGKAEPIGLGAQFHEPPCHGPVSRSKTLRNATRNRSEPVSKAFT